MSSWYSSWFTGLPVFDFAVPSTIQRRFFSFLLRRTLGHFLKPGQLDLHQIDSQLGSGTLHVKDLELDGQGSAFLSVAINQLLVGLPVTLYDGFISGVTARIPFPNPLSSTVGCQIQSLSLTFQITPEQPISPSSSLHDSSGLADSVASVAETFIHGELTPREEATLRQTLKLPTVSPSPEDEIENLPGGFNPFGNTTQTEELRKESTSDDDPAGVSIFATLIERLLAKFEFLAVDTKITIIHPGQASFTASISELSYRTDANSHSEVNGGSQLGAESNDHRGQTRTLSISGLKLTSRDLRVIASSPTITSTSSSVSSTASRKSSHCNPSVGQLSRNSSSSSLDEDTQLMMSQSIAMLPPSSLHLSSASSSMYQSALSTGHPHPVNALASLSSSPVVDDLRNVKAAQPSTPYRESDEDTLLSFGSQPIVFSLQTPSRLTQSSGKTFQSSDDHLADVENSVRDKFEQETLQLTVSVGVLACAFRSRHLRLVMEIVNAWISKPPSSPPVSHKDSEVSAVAVCLEANVTIRAIVIIALPELATAELFSLDAFYERPLVPPRLSRTYLRLFVDTLSVSLRLPTSSNQSMSADAPRTLVSVPVDRLAFAKIAILDVSLFAFHAVASDDPHVAAPILVTDEYLPTSYVAQHHRPSLVSERPQDVQLPLFEIVDWTQTKFKSGSARLSTWRMRNRAVFGKTGKSYTPSQRPTDLSSPQNPLILSPLSEAEHKLPMFPAIEISVRLGLPSLSKRNSLATEARIAPLHVFLDLGMIFKENLFLRFIDDIASAVTFTPKKGTNTDNQMLRQRNHNSQLSEDDVDMGKDIGVHPISRHARERAEERNRLEALVLQDLDLGMNYQHMGTMKPVLSQRQASPGRKKTAQEEPDYIFRLECLMIRIEIRCSPPPARLQRSGCMLFDFRGLIISNGLSSTKSSLRFSEAKSSPPSPDVILNVRLEEILAAYAPVGDNVAHVVLMLGFLPCKETVPDANILLATETVLDSLPISVVMGRHNMVEKSRGNTSSKLSITIDIPLVNLIMDKVVFDGLQYWADDVAQLIERSFSDQDGRTETLPSHNPSLIGSRYFTQLRRSGTHNTNENVEGNSNDQNTSETTIAVIVTEVLLRFIVPRSGEYQQARPFDIFASDVGAFLELKPEGKENTISGEILNLRVADTSTEGDCVLLLENPARRVLSTPKSLVEFKITSFAVPETTAKESRIKLSLSGFTIHSPLDGSLGNDLAMFAKAPPGVFESVIPSECTRLTVGVGDVSVHLHALGYPGAAVLHLGEAEFATDLTGSSCESIFNLSVSSSHVFLVDSIQDALESTGGRSVDPLGSGIDFWKNSGYALIAEIFHSQLAFRTNNNTQPPDTSVLIERISLRIHLCADTIGALTNLITNMTRAPKDDTAISSPCATPELPDSNIRDLDMTTSLDEHAFRLIPEVGSAADMISDDLPANQDYLDESFGAAAGLRELRDDDLDDFDVKETDHHTPVVGQLGIVSNVGGETVRLLKPLAFKEHYFDTISPDASRDPDDAGDTTLRVRIRNSDVVLFLHDGFDWPRTRRIIEKEVKEMRKRLARIRQLVSSGQTPEPVDGVTSTTLFNSFHIGLERDLESMDPDALVAAIDDELDDPTETMTESSWQSLPPASPGRPRVPSIRTHGKRLTRSKGPSIEIRLEGLFAEIDNYRPDETLASRTLILVRDLEILDHVKTSTWKKFLTGMRSDSRGNVRETDSNAARIELLSVRPSPLHRTEEARLRAKILPLRLYVDQDALDFFKKFFAFQDPDGPSVSDSNEKKEEIYFQHAEVFPVDIKLDYKPRRVDYKALRDGRTIELMNFFHFDGAEMTLRHLTLHGITGWPRFFDTLNDLWTPDVKATQLVDVISGVAPIRSVVNVGSGVADLVLLPIAQYKKDGRVVRGLQKGTKAFVQSTAMEAIKLGARLATGTQVILEQAENVLGGQFKDPVTTEALQIPYDDEYAEDSDSDLISRYAAQPSGLKEGVHSAYRSLQKNLHSAAQTILAVPMEVYERSGNEGAVRAVIRAVPIAVLKPMIGASEAVSKTLMGLHNTLDPSIRLENEAKYKHR